MLRSNPHVDLDITSSTGLQDSSALLKHELAYCLGQMKLESALPALEKTLRDTTEDPMVRHEVSSLRLASTFQILKLSVSRPQRLWVPSLLPARSQFLKNLRLILSVLYGKPVRLPLRKLNGTTQRRAQNIGIP